jgi:thiol-disulfide isomerase/thioredoxin
VKTIQFSGNRARPALRAALCAVALIALSAAALGEQPSDILSRDSVLRDPDVPSLGNPSGNLTVVEFFDYQCPYCKKMAPELAKLVQDDGNIKIVLKDWPINSVTFRCSPPSSLWQPNTKTNMRRRTTP